MQRDTSWGIAHKNRAALLVLSGHIVWGISTAMLDQEKISMGRVRQAYGLNENEVEKAIGTLWPGDVFPLELWRKAYERFWRGFADSNQAVYGVESPPLPEVDTTQKYFHPHLCALDVMTFFRKLSLNIKAGTLREGLKYILEETYENIDAVFPEEREFLFNTLTRLETVDIYDQYSPDSELFDEKILSLPASSYHFISSIFSDTVLVNKVAVVRFFRNYPLKQKVKGLTRAFVKSALDSLAEEAASAIIPTPQPEVQVTAPPAPPSTGSKKDIERINATRQVCEEIIEELFQEKQMFESDRNNWKQSLLFDNGKSNWKTFRHAVETRLGQSLHIEAARAEWKKVPDSLIHRGRVREQ